MTFPKELPTITLADGEERHLRYPLSAVKRIKTKYGADLPDMMKNPLEDLLPDVLMEGIVEKDGLTAARIADELLTGPMVEGALLAFVGAFFGEKRRQTVEEMEQTRQALLKTTMQQALQNLVTPSPAPKSVQ